MAEDFYSVLGVPKTADADTIKKAYRKLARDLHPDKNPGDKTAETRFKAVNRAYETLHDDKKRGLYDEFGEDSLREGFDEAKARAYRSWGAGGGRPGGGWAASSGGFGGGQRINIEDLFGSGVRGDGDFADIFSRAGAGRGRSQAKGSDVEQEITLDFDTAVRGTQLQLRRPDSNEAVTVRVPPGADDGSRVRIPGQGASSPYGGPNGDLVLLIHVTPHRFFKREGDDLYVDVPINASEAIRGAKVKVPTLDGSVALKVPPGTQSGTELRVRGKGVTRKAKTGDLYVRLMIQIPNVGGAELEKIASELERHEDKSIRAKLGVD